MITQRRQTYGRHVNFNSIMVFMCLFQSKKILKGWLQPKLKGASVWPFNECIQWLHISPVFHQLHWLPVRQQVLFKTTTLIYWSLSANVSGYLADDYQLIADAIAVSDNCVLPTFEHSSVGCAAVFQTGPLLLQNQKSGTVWCPISDYVGCHTASSGSYRRHFYLDSEAMAQCELF